MTQKPGSEIVCATSLQNPTSIFGGLTLDGFAQWLRPGALQELESSWQANAFPFQHAYVDGFFRPEIALQLSAEFLDSEDVRWRRYDNPIERKSLINHWDAFPPETYSVLEFLNSPTFTRYVGSHFWPDAPLMSDPGLNGGGWHLHGRGEKLNVHLDYSLHPKLGMQRVLNLIVYLTPQWDPSWGGGLGLWAGDRESPQVLEKAVDCVFNRAVLFDTTGNSWHGLPDPLECPEDVRRQSLAVYYLAQPPKGVDERGKALFAPTSAQKEDAEVLDLIQRRSNAATAHQVYE